MLKNDTNHAGDKPILYYTFQTHIYQLFTYPIMNAEYDKVAAGWVIHFHNWMFYRCLQTAKLIAESSQSCKELMGTDKGIPSLGSAEVRLGYAASTRLMSPQLSLYSVQKFESPVSWRLTCTEDSSSRHLFKSKVSCAEVNFPHWNGKSYLFVIRRTYVVVSNERAAQRKWNYLMQRVRLTGLSAEEFDNAVLSYTMVYNKMSAQFPLESVLPWQAAVYEGHPAIDFNARYFTKRSDAPNETSLPFQTGVDPKGILKRLRGQDLIHGPDNCVQYLQHLDLNRYVVSSGKTIELIKETLDTNALIQECSKLGPSGGDNCVHGSTCPKRKVCSCSTT